MLKSNFFKTTIILLIASMITKLLGFVIRLYITKIIGLDGNSLLSIINPIYSLLTQIVSFSFPLTISKLISERKYASSKIIVNALYIMIILNILVIFVVGLNANFIATTLLKNKTTNYLIITMLLTLPFISISSIVKGYFFGNQKMLPYAFSNILEQLFRLICFLLFLNKIFNYNGYVSILFIIGLNIFSETFSVFIFYLFLPKKIVFNTKLLNYDYQINKDIIALSTPNVLSKVIGNIFYFLEPIILIHFLLNKNLTYYYITTNYALYNIYSLSILMLPSFIIGAIETSLIPELSKLYKFKNKKAFISRIKKSIFISLIIGLFFMILIDIFGKQLLSVLYHDISAYKYLFWINQYFFLYYLESPINSALTALFKNKIIFITTIISNIIKIILMIIFINLNYKLYSLVIAEFGAILVVLLINGCYLKRIIKDLF